MSAVLVALCPRGLALDPTLDVGQYAHTEWKIRDGFPKGYISSIAQTPDGYLWLGSEFGLVRFDGVRGVEWQPPTGQHLPSSNIFSLLATRDGTLWIGTLKGLASWKDGKLTRYPELAEQYIFKLLEDREGTIWASGFSTTTGRLCAIRDGIVHCYGADGALGRGAFNLYDDSKGNLWAGVKNGVWRWKPGPSKFYPLDGEPDGIQGVGEDDNGALLIGWNGGLRRLVDGRIEPYEVPGDAGQFRGHRLLRDRDGGLWVGTTDRGIVHIHQGRTDVFGPSEGLSNERIGAMFEDREGNIWVTTPNGIDRFHDLAVARVSVSQGLSNPNVVSVLAAKDGSVWLATRGGLSRWMHGQITNYRRRSSTDYLTGHGERARNLDEVNPIALFQDVGGRIWVATLHGLGYLENDRFVPVRDIPGGPVTAMAQDSAGSLWVSEEAAGLFQVAGCRLVQRIEWPRLGRGAHVSAAAADPAQGVWVGFHLGGIAYLSSGQVRKSYGTAEGLGEGRVNHLQFDQGGALWASTDGGLSRLKDGRVGTLTSRNGLPCDTVHWTMEDDAGSFWLYTACGLLRISRAELNAWAAGPQRTVHFTVFDISDGVRPTAMAGHFSGQVVKSADGKIWFLPLDGASVIDPRHIPFNKLPPPVHIERIIADRKSYDAAAGKGLPSRIRDLEVDYTALSFVAPEKVRFRYRLEGYDRDWQEAGNRRQAFYTNLPPRQYRFRVKAANNSGVWNEAGAALDFAIAPAFYQTSWFLAACAAAILAFLGGLYYLRMEYVKRQFNMRLEERVKERTRVARDLHDTLLQSFQGLLLKFHSVTYDLPDRPAEAQKTLESAIEQARAAVTEGRDAVQGLRSSLVVTNDLARAISTLGEGLGADEVNGNRPEFRVQVEGKTRDLSPLVRDEIYRIAGEALRNGFRHADARRIEVEMHYEKRLLRMRVRDNGKGIDPKILDAGGRAGHHGLAGMQERAKLVRGKLAVFSQLDSGTEIELTIPASIAYTKSPPASRSMSSGTGTG